MTIQHAILGMLRLQPMTGYDLKKVMQDSAYLYWSGNNNQIYKALLELLEDGLVNNEVQHQQGGPTKKEYTITQKGLKTLKEWSLLPPELPDCKRPFLAQLAFADILSDEALLKLLLTYENEVWMQLRMCEERVRRGSDMKPRSERETLLWEAIEENIAAGYQQELTWVRGLRERLAQSGMKKEGTNMQYQIITKDTKPYIEVRAHETGIQSTADTMDLISLCVEHDCGLILLYEEALSKDFFQLKTGVAGELLQKLVNYRVRTALLLHSFKGLSARFLELIGEANKGNQYRFFEDHAEAVDWLLKEV